MSEWTDRLIADGLERAASAFAVEAKLGNLLWSVGGYRCFARWDGVESTLTVVGKDGSLVQHVLVGVSTAVLR